MIAANKAWTAAREQKAWYELGQAARDPQTGLDLADFGGTRYVGWGGGVPVWLKGVVVGAVAVRGLPEAVDLELVQLGREAIERAARR